MGKRGFTLIELLLVVAIMLILAGAMIPLFNVSRAEAREARARADLDSIKTGSVMYRHDVGGWPTDSQAELALITGTGIANWEGPYVTAVSPDPWGNAYEIYTEAGTGDLCVSSWGPDEVDDDGGGDDITQIITAQ